MKFVAVIGLVLAWRESVMAAQPKTITPIIPAHKSYINHAIE